MPGLSENNQKFHTYYSVFTIEFIERGGSHSIRKDDAA
jgi:hypothetical protein